TNQLSAFYDNNQLITMIDTETQSYPSGPISLDMWTATLSYTMAFDDVQVVKLGDDTIAARPQALQIQSIAVLNNTATVAWAAISGRSYRMQYKDSLTNSNWTDIVP